ncbi:MAG: hypothetical protein Q7K29_05935 [Thermoleophilia bacterium]|nr:hypothetical protein [Thermoleophilia bacterium]
MECYLCKHCKAVTNFPITGSCEESPTEEHEWVSGEMVENQVQMMWEREPDSLTSASS